MLFFVIFVAGRRLSIPASCSPGATPGVDCQILVVSCRLPAVPDAYVAALTTSRAEIEQPEFVAIQNTCQLVLMLPFTNTANLSGLCPASARTGYLDARHMWTGPS